MTAPALPAPAVGAKRKREKIAGACTSCRRSKVKCEEARPCTRCISHGWRNSCVSWPHIKPRRRQQYDAERVDLQPATVPPPPPPPPPPSLAAQSLFDALRPSYGLPHGRLGELFAPAEVRPASECAAPSVVFGEGSCAGIDAAGDDWAQPSSEPVALGEADTEPSDDENDDFWSSVEHLKAIPIAFDPIASDGLL